MKTIAIPVILAGLLWAGSIAFADEVTDPSYDPYGDEPAPPVPPVLMEDPPAAETPADPQSAAGDDAAAAKDRLMRKIVVTVDGDEIGVINDVGYSAAYGEPVAVVDVDAFIGIGEKRIAIPLSQLQADDPWSSSVMTMFTRDAIEAEEAFDEADFTAIE